MISQASLLLTVINFGGWLKIKSRCLAGHTYQSACEISTHLFSNDLNFKHFCQYPERVDSLMVANACSGKAGWVEWGYQVEVNLFSIISKSLSVFKYKF